MSVPNVTFSIAILIHRSITHRMTSLKGNLSFDMNIWNLCHFKAMCFSQVGPRCRFISCDPGMKCNETCGNLLGYECIGKSNSHHDQHSCLQWTASYSVVCKEKSFHWEI